MRPGTRAALGLLAVAGAASCASAPARAPVAFGKSAAFRAMAQHVQAFLETDLDGDGLADAVVLKRAQGGFAPVAFVARPDIDERFVGVCEGPVLEGEELTALRWVGGQAGAAFAAVASDETPDGTTQHVGLFVVGTPCTPLLQVTTHATWPAAATIIAPPWAQGGVSFDAQGLTLVDEPRATLMRSEEGEVALLTGARRRTVRLVDGAARMEERQERYLGPVELQAHLGELALPELLDADPTTATALRAGEGAVLRLQAGQKMQIVELSHGCTDGPTEPLELGASPGGAFRTGSPPTRDSFVLSAAMRLAEYPVARTEVLALRTPTQELALTLAPAASVRCLRSIRAWAFALPPANP